MPAGFKFLPVVVYQVYDEEKDEMMFDKKSNKLITFSREDAN